MSSTKQTDPLSQNPFLVNLAATFKVTSIPLAIFILIVICLACIFLLVIVILIVRSFIKKRNLVASRKKRLKTVYLDEICGLPKAAGDRGQISYSLEYVIPSKTLRVMIEEGKDLLGLEDSKYLDTYATLKLIIERSGQYKQIGKTHKTELKRKTNYPRWYTQCEFTIAEEDLGKARLIFEIFDYDNIGQDRSIGVLDVELSTLDEGSYIGAPLERVGYLKPGIPKFVGLGEVSIGLTYNAKTERLEVNLYEARQLTIKDLLPSSRKTEICIFVEIKVKGKTIGTFESSVKSELVNPYFNEKASFALKKANLNDTCCKFYLRRRGKLGRRHTLGTLMINPNVELSTGAKHWDEMIKNSPRTHVMWHTWVPKGWTDDV